ncbi:adhesion G protein-coupled receptor E2-like isoform X3, partial [Silurus meridionalis]
SCDTDEDECKEEVCGNNAVCTNTIGGYYCQCKTGYQNKKRKLNFTAEDELQCEGQYVYNTDFISWINGALRINLNLFSCYFLSDINECTENKTICDPNALCNNTIGSYFCVCAEGFVASNKQERFNGSQNVTCNALFNSVENALLLIGQLANSSISQSNLQNRVELLIHRSPNAPHGGLSMSTDSVQLNSHWETAAGNSYKGYAAASMITYESLDNNNSAINSYSRRKSISTDQFRLNSKVVTITVTNRDTAHLKKSVKLTFSHLQETSMKSVCVFWDSTLKGGAWSNEGCTVHQSNTKSTVCLCSHLSSFAVLMALYEMEDVFELKLITWIGLSLSLICFLICILTFWLIRSIQSTRTTIHLHLCISFFIADFIFLVGINQTTNKVGCGVVAGLLHFFFLSVFCWMCLEGVQLFRMVVLVFNTTLSRGYMMAAGYGIPALIVIISASVNYRGYGTPRYCWLSLENDFMWSFFGPVCTIIVVNAIFFIITVMKLAQKFNSLNPDLSNLRKIKTFTITAIAQLCVLGIMWIFGCFQFNEEMLVMSYLFTILNSFQGVLMFIMHCLFSKQVRDEYIRFLTCLTMQKSSYSEFSTNQSSKSQ